MLSTFLDAPTLFTLFDAPGPAVQRTIEAGGWGGMLWPGHPEWDEAATRQPDHWHAGTQLLSLALHYFTARHPEADAFQISTAAQVLCRYAVEFLGGYPIEEEDLYERADAWLLALAGGTPPEPGGTLALTPPYDEEGHPLLPGSDIVTFTRAMVPIIEALVFEGEAAARRLAEAFLRHGGDLEAQRAAEIFRCCVLGERLDLDAAVTCADCGATDLDVWYSGQTWGEMLCEACYTARVAQGQARPQQDTDEMDASA
jgi:hypothetical protein